MKRKRFKEEENASSRRMCTINTMDNIRKVFAEERKKSNDRPTPRVSETGKSEQRKRMDKSRPRVNEQRKRMDKGKGLPETVSDHFTTKDEKQNHKLTLSFLYFSVCFTENPGIDNVPSVSEK